MNSCETHDRFAACLCADALYRSHTHRMARSQSCRGVYLSGSVCTELLLDTDIRSQETCVDLDSLESASTVLKGNYMTRPLHKCFIYLLLLLYYTHIETHLQAPYGSHSLKCHSASAVQIAAIK